MFECSLLEYRQAPWQQIASCSDHLVYKSKAWMDFLSETQGIRPLVLAIDKDGRRIGFFMGGTFRKGLKIIASPFEGWGTEFQGLSVLEPVTAAERLELYHHVVDFCRAELGFSFFQASDWSLRPADMADSGFQFQPVPGYRMDLTLDEPALFARFTRTCRRAVVKAGEGGLTAGEAADPEAFVQEYYRELLDVFGKRDAKPTFPLSRVQALVRHLGPAGEVLLMETRSPDQAVIATNIFILAGRRAHWWGSASYRAHQLLRPNELLFWEAVRILKRRGVTELELGSTGVYKEKYGPEPCAGVQILVPRWAFLPALKAFARKLYFKLR